MSRGKIWFMTIGMIVLIVFGVLMTYFDKKDSREYFSRLHLQMSGIVTDKKDINAGNGLLYLDLKYSSISEYDIRKTKGFYYCVIHNGKAELVEVVCNIHIGDSIVVNSDSSSFKSYRDHRLVINNRLYLTQFAPITQNLKWFHRL